METVVVVEGIDEGKFEDCELENSAYSTSPPKQITDPVVYKLVRVEGDGRLVPATDDEIMEVVDLLKDEKGNMNIADDSEENVGISIEESSNKTALAESSGLAGFSSCQNVKDDAEKMDPRIQENALPSTKNLDASDANLSDIAGQCSNPLDRSQENEALPTVACGSSMPDFSKLKGEICLDNLSIRELHETFRATFGRETTVKDKAWLKRRIAMGLSNSCDVSTTSFIIKDDKVLEVRNEKISTCIADASTSLRNSVGLRDEPCQGSPTNNSSHMEDCQVVPEKRLRNHDLVDGCTFDVLQQEATAKRIRKPTRRYIEELSEGETRERSGRLITSSRGSEQFSPKSGTRTGLSSDGKIMVTRLDSLSGIQVPYVSRIRRSRPRKDIMSLMSGLGLAANFEKSFGRHSYQSATSSGNNNVKTSSTFKQVQLTEEQNEHEGCSFMDDVDLRQKDVTLKDPASSEDVSNDNVATVPTAKGGLRRKHHRAWTLSEVIKLVEGVSRYGAGRWSEIKRLAFASYSYRTSVDLKDKWRNLLKAANFSSAPTDLMNSRKHVVTPIPAPILSRIRELAEINSRTPSPTTPSSGKVTGSGERTANGSTPTGYL